MTESKIQAQIRLALGSDPRVLLWRNAAGVATQVGGGAPRTQRFGLAVGAADLVGIVTLESGLGRFFALEVKTPTGRVSEDQRRWIALVKARGGYASVVRSVDEAQAAVEDAIRGV